MGLITSTGFFKYIPPNPKITSISSPTGNLGDIISIFGTDLDYVDNLYFGEDNLNFAILDNFQRIEFQVPFDPSTGVLEIKSNSFELTGDNKIAFLPLFQIEDFNPKSASEGDLITVSGKVLNSIISGNVYANPITDDIPYYFSGNRNIFCIDTSRKGIEGSPFNANFVLFLDEFNTIPEINSFRARGIEGFTLSSGKQVYAEFDKVSDLSQKYYEINIIGLPYLEQEYFQTNRVSLDTGYNTYTINLASGFSDLNYSIFYTTPFSGATHYYSFIKNKTTGSFDIEFSNTLTNNTVDFQYVAVKNTGFIYDSGEYKVYSSVVPAGYTSHVLPFDNDKLYKPFLISNVEKINGQDIGNAYIGLNNHNFINDEFTLNVPNANPSHSFKINYLTVFNSGTNLSTFLYDSTGSYFKKAYLAIGNQDSFQERIPLENLTGINKNILTFNMPDTDLHVNGLIELINSTGIVKLSNINILETPLATGVLPIEGRRGTNIMIVGKSFKKPILIDGTGDYNGVIVRFRYADNIYLEKKNTFEADFILIDKGLLSGKIPIKNIPTGRYALQMISENGSLFE